jgi:hypothetical protein
MNHLITKREFNYEAGQMGIPQFFKRFPWVVPGGGIVTVLLRGGIAAPFF